MFTVLPMVASSSGSGDSVNLEAQWSTFWGAISSATGFNGIKTLMGIVGAILVVLALLKFIWDKRRGMKGGQGHDALMGAGLVGAVLSAPTVFFPIGLFVIDLLINACISIWHSAGN